MLLTAKAVHPGHLYGEYNTTHQNWADGVLTAALRAACSRTAAGGRSWLVLDGPVDTVWVEALNPVLDDNRWVQRTGSLAMHLPNGCSSGDTGQDCTDLERAGVDGMTNKGL